MAPTKTTYNKKKTAKIMPTELDDKDTDVNIVASKVAAIKVPRVMTFANISFIVARAICEENSGSLR